MKRYLAPFISLAILAAIVAAPTQSFAATKNRVTVTKQKVALRKIAITKHRHHRRPRRRIHRHLVRKHRK